MKHRTKKILSYVVSLAIIGAAGWWVASNFLPHSGVEFTDNAQVGRQIVPVNCRVQGYIKEIRFKEFQEVKKGDTLVVIDDADLRLALARAKADYQTAVAGRGVADRAVQSSSADVAVSDASINEAKVVMDMARIELDRHQALLDNDAVTRREYDLVKTDYEAKKARYETLSRQRSAVSTVVDVNKSRISQSDAAVDVAATAVATAELNLSYAVVLAPCDGFVSRKDIQVGQLVQPGQTLVEIVDSSDVWVTANFKETQLPHINLGDTALIEVDAIPGVEFRGIISAISTATGASLSILPQDNSAGNFVKVRQRVPVRIEFIPCDNAALLNRLRAGMNVECKVKY